MFKSLFRNRSVVLSWLLSYVLLLAVPITITVLSYTEAEKIVENELSHANEILLEHSQLLMDNTLDDVNRLLYQIGINPKIRQLANADKELNTNDYAQVIQANKDLLTYKAITGFVKDVYIYFPGSDRILTRSVLIDKRTYFTTYWESKNLSYEKWDEITKGSYQGMYLPLNSPDNNGDITDILYTQGIPIVSSKPYAYVTILLDYSRMQDSISYMRELTQGWGMILNRDNQVLFEDVPFPVDLSSDFQALQANTESFVRKIDEKEYKISFIQSEKTKWKYVSIVPMEIYGKKVKDIRNISYITILLCLLLGGIIAFLFLRKNYLSIHTLLSRMQVKYNTTLQKGMNEYKAIEEIFTEAMEENREMQVNQNKVLRSNLLAKLLKGRLDDTVFIRKAIANYGIAFQSDSFAVILIYVMDYKKLFENDNSSLEAQERLVQTIITNIVEELAAQKNIGYMVEVENTIACMINFKQVDSQEQKKDITRIVEMAQFYLIDKFFINCIISASDVHKSLLRLQIAYQEALNIMEYKIVMDNQDIGEYKVPNALNNRYDYPIQTEQYLINCIKAGDLEEARNTIDMIFENNVAKMIPSMDMLRCFMFDLTTTMLKTLPEISFVSGNTFLEDLDVVNRLMRVKSITEFKKEILDILLVICAYIQDNKKDKNADLVTEVMEYIQGNYGDVNLNVSTVSERFQLSSGYLTKLFKEQTGEVLSTYITQIRLKESKKLLQKSQLSINEIAGKVGYYNSNIYIRAFKKFEGVTPGIYRSTLQEKEDI